jgi:hypothetical protein
MIELDLPRVIKRKYPTGETRLNLSTGRSDLLNQVWRVSQAVYVLLKFKLIEAFHGVVEMNSIIEVQVRPLYNFLFERSRQGDVHIDQVDVTHLLNNVPDVIPAALGIDFQEAILGFKPSSFSMI